MRCSGGAAEAQGEVQRRQRVAGRHLILGLLEALGRLEHRLSALEHLGRSSGVEMEEEMERRWRADGGEIVAPEYLALETALQRRQPRLCLARVGRRANH